MAFISILRAGFLVTTVLFSIIELGISAHLTDLTIKVLGHSIAAEGLAVAIAVLTLVFVPVMIIIDMVRRGAFSSMVVAELVVLGILWVLWLASGAKSVDTFNSNFPEGCDQFQEFAEVISVCRELQAVAAFGFLNWLILLGYWSILLICSVIAVSRDGDSRIWFTSVGETAFLSSRSSGKATMLQKFEPVQPGTRYGNQPILDSHNHSQV